MKEKLKRLLQYPPVAYTVAFFWGLFGLLVFVGMGGAIFSYSYFPLRLFYTGHKDIDVVKSRYYSEYVSGHSGAVLHSYYLVGAKQNYSYSVERTDYQKIKNGATINVYTSNKLKKGMYLGTQEPTLLTMFLSYEAGGILYSILVLIAIFLILSAVFLSIKSLIGKINRDVKNEVNNSKKPISSVFAYGKSYTTFLTGMAFSYAFSFLVIKGVYVTEALDPMVAGCIIFLGTLILLFTPILLYYIKGYFKSIRHKEVSYFLQLLSLCLGIYTTYKLFVFIHDHSSFDKNEDVLKVIVDFLKSLVP